jgi:hypothetical protein
MDGSNNKVCHVRQIRYNYVNRHNRQDTRIRCRWGNSHNHSYHRKYSVHIVHEKREGYIDVDSSCYFDGTQNAEIPNDEILNAEILNAEILNAETLLLNDSILRNIKHIQPMPKIREWL